jgi:hypothetical protein
MLTDDTRICYCCCCSDCAFNLADELVTTCIMLNELYRASANHVIVMTRGVHCAEGSYSSNNHTLTGQPSHVSTASYQMIDCQKSVASGY